MDKSFGPSCKVAGTSELIIMKPVSGQSLLAFVLAFLALAIPLIAQDEQSAPTSLLKSEPISPRPHGPVRDLVRHPDGTVSSSNWSGYAVTDAVEGSSITEAKG